MRAKLVYENINFKRGRKSKDAMNVGISQSIWPEIWDFFKKVRWDDSAPIHISSIYGSQGGHNLNIHGHGSKYKTNLNKLLKESPLVNYIEMPGKIIDRYGGSITASYPVKTDMYARSIKKFSSTYDYETKHNLDESVNFERGRDPKSAMGIGVADKFKKFSSRLAAGDTDDDPDVAYLAGGDAMEGETHYDQLVFEEALARDLCQEGKILSSGKVSDRSSLFGSSIDVKYEIYKTKLGLILKNTITLMGEIDAYSCLRSQYPDIKKYFEESYKKSLEREPHPDLRVDPEFLEILRRERLNENVNFERGKDPKSAMGIGTASQFDEYARKSDMKPNDLDEEETSMLSDDEVLGKWQQYSENQDRWYSGYVILFIDGDTGELNVTANSQWAEDEYPAKQWMNQDMWNYHFGI